MYTYPTSLESERLRSRYLANSDNELWENFLGDEESVEHFPPIDNMSLKEYSKFWIDTQLQRYKDNRYGLQAIIDKNTNELIGQCGLLSQIVDDIEELEVGYHVFRKYWGKGYAPEAAKLFIDFAFENNLSESVISIIHKDNVKSQRVAEKNGLKREKETLWRDLPVFIYRIEKKYYL